MALEEVPKAGYRAVAGKLSCCWVLAGTIAGTAAAGVSVGDEASGPAANFSTPCSFASATRACSI